MDNEPNKLANQIDETIKMVAELNTRIEDLEAKIDRLERLKGGAAVKSSGNIANKATDPFRKSRNK